MLLDIGIGILASIFTSRWFDVEFTKWWLFLGAGFALLPDIDVFYELITRKGKVGGNVLGGHREVTHYPLLYPVWILITYFIWGVPIATLLGTGLFWHVLHDSIGLGWGIQWLAPISRRHYKFFSKKPVGLSWRNPIIFFEREEAKKLIVEHADPNWIKNLYLRPSFTSIAEAIGFAIALVLLYFYLR